MKKLLIIVVIISVIMILLGDYINSLLVSVSGTLPTILQPFSMFITFYVYAFDAIFSNYYLSLFINIIIVFFLFSLLINWLAGVPSGIKQFSQARKQEKRLNENERKSKVAAEIKYNSNLVKDSKKGFRSDYRETTTASFYSKSKRK